MSFREQIERIVNEVPGCVSCTLMGFDGIAVDTVDRSETVDGVNISDATIEYANLVRQMRTAAEGLASGAIEEVCVRSEKLSTVLRPINEEYLVAASFSSDGLLGKGRYLLRVIAPRLGEEL